MGATVNESDSRRVAVAAGDLPGLDALDDDVEAVGLFSFSDQRPLRGVAGHVDWRVCGALSRALLGGAFVGNRGEVMMLPSRGRLGRRRLFVFGLGSVREAGPHTYGEACRTALRVMEAAGVSRVVLGCPASPELPEVERHFLAAVEENLTGRVHLVLLERSP